MKVLIIDKDVTNSIDLSMYEGDTESRLTQYAKEIASDPAGLPTYSFLDYERHKIIRLGPLDIEGFDIIFNFTYQAGNKTLKAVSKCGNTLTLGRIAPSVYCVYHTLGWDTSALPATGQINWVDGVTLKYVPQLVTVLNQDSSDMCMEAICTEDVITRIFACGDEVMPFDYPYHLPKSMELAWYHLPWESTYLGNDYKFHDNRIDEGKDDTTVIRFTPEPGVIIDIHEMAEQEKSGMKYMKFIRFAYPNETTVVHGGKKYTAKMTSIKSLDIHNYIEDINTVLDVVKMD